MTSEASVGINNYFASCQSGVGKCSTNDKPARSVYDVSCLVVQHVGGYHVLNHLIDYVFSHLLPVSSVCMLRRNYYSSHSGWFSLTILYSNLRLAVWS